MYNILKDQNLELIEKLKKEGYTDLGWMNDGHELTIPNKKSKNKLQELDCSMYANRGTHIVYVDHDHQEILHVDMSD